MRSVFVIPSVGRVLKNLPLTAPPMSHCVERTIGWATTSCPAGSLDLALMIRPVFRPCLPNPRSVAHLRRVAQGDGRANIGEQPQPLARQPELVCTCRSAGAKPAVQEPVRPFDGLDMLITLNRGTLRIRIDRALRVWSFLQGCHPESRRAFTDRLLGGRLHPCTAGDGQVLGMDRDTCNPVRRAAYPIQLIERRRL